MAPVPPPPAAASDSWGGAILKGSERVWSDTGSEKWSISTLSFALVGEGHFGPPCGFLPITRKRIGAT